MEIPRISLTNNLSPSEYRYKIKWVVLSVRISNLLKNLYRAIIYHRIGNHVHACKESMREDLNINK